MLLCLVVFSHMALAQTPGELEARTLFKEGNRRLEAGEYSEALDLYRAAYARYPSPKILLNLGTVLRQLARHAEAAETYEKYLADPGADPARIAEVKQVLADLHSRVGRLSLKVNEAGARVALDGKALGETPAISLIRVEPGTHSVVAEKSGFVTAFASVSVAAGEERVVTLTLVPQAPAPTVAPSVVPVVSSAPEPAPEVTKVETRPFYTRWWFWTGAGALVAGSIAIVFATSGEAEPAQLEVPPADAEVRGNWSQ